MIRLFCQENDNPFPNAVLDYIIYSVNYHFELELSFFAAFLSFLSLLNANILSFLKLYSL